MWDDENKKHLAQVIGYNENERYPFFIKKEQVENNGFAYTNTLTSLKKKMQRKLELLKKADELLTKGSRAKSRCRKNFKIMASLSEIYVKKSTLETIIKALNAKQGKDAEGVKLTISLSVSEQLLAYQNVVLM